MLLQDGKALAREDAGVDVRIGSQCACIDVSQPRTYYLVKTQH